MIDFNNFIQDCVVYLNGVNTVTARYRMTNKPAPTTASAYVGEALEPLKVFASKYSTAAGLCSASSSRVWMAGVIEAICVVFRARVQSLIDTVKSMDAALNKRSGRPKATNPGGMSDSEKILLQLLLDVQVFATLAAGMDVPVELIPSYAALLSEVQEGAPAVVNITE